MSAPPSNSGSPVPLTPALSRLSELIDGLDAGRRDAARTYAAQLQLFAGLIPVVQARREERVAAHANPRHQNVSLADREVVADVAAALRVSERVVHARMSRARQVVTVFPAVHAALAAGSIDAQHAHVICDVGTVLDSWDVDETVRAQYAAAGVAVAMEETAPRLRGILTALVSRLAPEAVEEQVVDAATMKCLRVFDLTPGLARLTLDGPTAEIHGIHDRASQQARLIQQSNDDEAAKAQAEGRADESCDERTLDQIRADIAIDELLTGTPTAHGATTEQREELGRIRGGVTVVIPATTLAGTTTGGAIIPGHGSIDAATAKAIASAAPVWTRLFTDPVTGTPVEVDTYKPCTAQRRWLNARDERCRFPGCRRPAVKCEVDHTVAWEHDGPTALWNLANLTLSRECFGRVA